MTSAQVASGTTIDAPGAARSARPATMRRAARRKRRRSPEWYAGAPQQRNGATSQPTPARSWRPTRSRPRSGRWNSTRQVGTIVTEPDPVAESRARRADHTLKRVEVSWPVRRRALRPVTADTTRRSSGRLVDTAEIVRGATPSQSAARRSRRGCWPVARRIATARSISVGTSTATGSSPGEWGQSVRHAPHP